MKLLSTDKEILEKLFNHDSHSSSSFSLNGKVYFLKLFSIYWPSVGYRIFEYNSHEFLLLKLIESKNEIIELQGLYSLDYQEVKDIKKNALLNF
ncbi:hypothetical protein ABID22_000327 [Pontibacter aydingkolensis]|uniref:Uncharacterized protein n=1 Tax=Pontibacter aydingkolensis TaxID=1911536 RepID=A0ABS7CQ81_9BACT|nr:hypothetical protein [Pontibacter aydingkolensis]MBW7466007.1 hypothetical protein [Pontibacter aydingkolensis]